MYVVWTILSVLAGLALLDLIIRGIYIRHALPMFEHTPTFCIPDTSPALHAIPFNIPTTQGLTLKGSWFHQEDRQPKGVILFCHEFGGSRWSAMSYCAGLFEAGFDIVSFDFRNQNDSDYQPHYEPLHWLTEYEVNDVLAAIRFIQDHDDLRLLPIGLFGVSKGGCAALAGAARSKAVRAVATDGAYSADQLMVHHILRWMSLYPAEWLLRLMPIWHIRITTRLIRAISEMQRGCRYTNLESWLPRLRRRPVFLITGGRDTYVFPEITEQLRRRAGCSPDDVWVVDGAKHNLARQVQPEEYDHRLSTFFATMWQESEAESLSSATLEEAPQQTI